MVTSPPQSLSNGKVTPIFSATAQDREPGIHAHTQHLGIGGFQLGEVLLESLHLLGSTPGEGENVERQGDVLLALEIMQRNLVAVLVG